MLKSTKNAENHKHTKNHIIIRHVVPQLDCRQAFYQFWSIVVPLPNFWPKISKFLKIEKKPLNMLSFYIPLGVY